MRLLRNLLLLLLSICIADQGLATQKAPDETLRDRLVGTWRVDISATNGKSLKGYVVLKADGTFMSSAEMTSSSEHIHLGYGGKWRVENGILIEETLTTESPERTRVGTVTRDTILKLDDAEFEFRTESGFVDKRRRVKYESFLKKPNQALQHNDPSCHVPCLRTDRASRCRG